MIEGWKKRSLFLFIILISLVKTRADAFAQDDDGIVALYDDLIQTIEDSDIRRSTRVSLRALLRASEKAYDEDNFGTASKLLTKFVDTVERLSGGKISQELADRLKVDAERIASRIPDDGEDEEEREEDIPGLGFLGTLVGSFLGLSLASNANKDGKQGQRKWIGELAPWMGVLRFISFPLLLTLSLVFIVGFEPYQAFIAKICSSILTRVNVIHGINGHSLLLDLNNVPYNIVISEECSGISSILLFVSVVIGLPGALNRRKIGAILFGVPLMLLGDLVRISSLVFLSYNFYWAPYMVLHDFFGRPLSLVWSLLVTTGYLFWEFLSQQERMT